jgi:PBP1b-binding outer membrane lipoprotein LpoB
MKTLLIIGIIFLSGCTNRDDYYKEVTPSQLKKEIKNTESLEGMICIWT